MPDAAKLFQCDQCRLYHSMLRKLCSLEACGFMCDDCWKLFRKRVVQILHPLRANNAHCLIRYVSL